MEGLQLTESIAQVTGWLAGWLRGIVVSLGQLAARDFS